MRVHAAILGLVLLSCTTLPERTQSPNYQLGFADGCASASIDEGGIPRRPRRNEALFQNDPDYRAGWISGQASCRMMGGPPRR